MKCHIELACYISPEEEISKGEMDRLLQTIGTYLSSCGGVPHVDSILPEVEGDALCITAYATAGIPRGKLQDASYVKRQVTAGLKKAGMNLA